MFFSNFTTFEIDGMTYLECEKYYEFHTEYENTKTKNALKLFAFYNLETTLVASNGKRDMIKKYFRRLFDDEFIEDNEIEDQFEGVDFGEQD